MRWQHHDGNISIYNNTFSSDAHPGAHAGATRVMIIYTYQPHHYGTLSIKNNILSGFGIDISGITISDWDSIDIDYNLHHISTAHGYGYPVCVGSKRGKMLACAQSTWGYEMHSHDGRTEVRGRAERDSGKRRLPSAAWLARDRGLHYVWLLGLYRGCRRELALQYGPVGPGRICGADAEQRRVAKTRRRQQSRR